MFDNKFSPPPPLSLLVVSIERNKKKSHVRLPKLTNHSSVPVASSPLVHCTWTLKTHLPHCDESDDACEKVFKRGQWMLCLVIQQR